MIENFLRRPSGPGEIFADIVRLLGVASVIVAGIGWGFTQLAVLALALLGILLPRFLILRPSFDAAFGTTVLVATWSGVFGLYVAVPGWDLLIHFVFNGLAAALAYFFASRWGAVPDPRDESAPLMMLAVLTTAFGLSAAVVWELAEWAGFTFIDETIFVGYQDTIGDLAVAALGSILAGAGLRVLAPQGSRARAAAARPSAR